MQSRNDQQMCHSGQCERLAQMLVDAAAVADY
jgi:hypothetical protein